MSFPPPPSANPTHALANAILNYKPEWAKIALEQGADIFAKGWRGETLLAGALVFGLRASKSREKSVSGRMFAEGQIKIAALLLEHSRTQPIERFGLFDAVVARNFPAIEHNLQPARLAQNAGDEYRKALAHAVQYDDAEIVKLLLSVERFSLADAVNAKDPAAVRSAIERAPLQDTNAEEYHKCLVDAVQQDYSDIVELLLDAGLSPNTRINRPREGAAELILLSSAALPWNGWPLLTFAAARGSTKAMRVLLKAGADPNAKAGSTAQPHGPFRDGAYERGLAIGRRIARAQEAANEAALAHLDADDDTQSLSRLNAINAALTSMPAADYGVQYSDHAAHITPLMIAANTSSLDAVKQLVLAGAELGARDKNGRTALTYAQAGGFKRVIAYLEAAYETQDAAGALTLREAAATGAIYRVKALLEAGADIEERDGDGQTPLMLAVAAGHVELVELLCAAGANVQAVRTDGGDLWTCALAKPDMEILRCLIEHGLSPNQTRRSGPALLLTFRLEKPKDVLNLLLDSGADVQATVPAEVIEKAQRQRQKPLQFLRPSRLGAKRENQPSKDLKSPCSVLEFAKHFASRDVYYILHTHAGAADEGDEFFYESVRDALKQCAVLADEKFKAEAARIGTILHAKPIAWKRRKGVLHYTSSLEKALAAHYGQPAPVAASKKGAPHLFLRLQAEVAANGYALVYTGLAEGSLQRLLLLPLKEPLAALAACGTNAANYGNSTRDVVNWCAETRLEHPLTVIGAGFDFMDLSFAQPIQNSEKLAARIAEFCPDIQVSAKDPQAVARFAKELAENGRCFFWWD